MWAAAIAVCQAGLIMAAENKLEDYPFWRAVAGAWRAENTYMDRDLNYNIRSYNSVILVEIDGRIYRETEIKSYAPSKLAQQNGRGMTTADEGIETVTVTTGELTDDAGTVRITATVPDLLGDSNTEIRILSPDTAVRVTPNSGTGVDTYRMFVFLPVANKRYRSNFGLVSDTTGGGAANAASDAKLGDLRGFSLFREDRIPQGDAEKWRAEFRAKNKVAAVVEAGLDGKPVVRRLK